MTVFPGFGGQKFIHNVLDKANDISEIRDSKNLDFLIEVDGGVGPEHVQPCMDFSVDVFVAGTATTNLKTQIARNLGKYRESPLIAVASVLRRLYQSSN